MSDRIRIPLPIPTITATTIPINSTTYRCCQPPYCHTEVQYAVTVDDMQAYSCAAHLAQVQTQMANRESGTLRVFPTLPDPFSLP